MYDWFDAASTISNYDAEIKTNTDIVAEVESNYFILQFLKKYRPDHEF